MASAGGDRGPCEGESGPLLGDLGCDEGEVTESDDLLTPGEVGKSSSSRTRTVCDFGLIALAGILAMRLASGEAPEPVLGLAAFCFGLFTEASDASFFVAGVGVGKDVGFTEVLQPGNNHIKSNQTKSKKIQSNPMS